MPVYINGVEQVVAHESTHVDGGIDEIDTALDVKALANVLYYGVSWDESKALGGYTRRGTLAGFPTGFSPCDALIPIQARMRRCVMNDAGVVQYYLCPTDSTKKSDGITASVLTGADGQVMVEIPKFYHRYSYAGTTHTHDISLYPLDGFTVHNAFVKNGAEVDYRYIGAYEAVLYDTSASRYANGLYLPEDASYKISFLDDGANPDTITSDSNTHAFTNIEAGDIIVVSASAANDGTYTVVSATNTVITLATGSLSATTANDPCIIQTQRDWTAATGDVLSSVSGKAPMNYGSRANFRAAAATRGTGWRQQDFDLVSATQLLSLVEYADWNSQSMIGNGLTDWTAAWPAWNNYNPIETCGNSNSDGNATASTSGGDGVVGSYMSYRGIENFFGHLWNWVDGINITGRVPWVSNTDTQFADDTTTNYTSLGVTLAASNEYVVTLEQIARGFLAASVTGSGSTYVTDYYYQNTGWRVAALGGGAYYALKAGVACWHLAYASDGLHRAISGRLAF